MDHRTRKLAAPILLAAVGIAGYASQAAAHAVAISAPGYRYVSVGADAEGNPFGPCSEFLVSGGGQLGPIVCFRPGSPGNSGYGSATAGPGNGRVIYRSFTNGTATAGPGVAAIGDTTVSDSMDVLMTSINSTQVQVVMNGVLRVQSRATRIARTTSKLIVYPDAATAQADLAGTGAGAAFIGTIRVESRPGLVPTAVFSGGLTAGDFVIDQSAGNTLNIRANNVTKVVNVPVSANAAVAGHSDPESGLPVPGQTPIGMITLALMMAGMGVLVFRRKRATTTA